MHEISTRSYLLTVLELDFLFIIFNLVTNYKELKKRL